MKIDFDPLQVGDANYEELVAINMVEITEDFKDIENQIEDVYPKAGEGRVEILHKCKAEDSKVMLYPRCNAVFDKKVAKKVEFAQQEKKQENWRKNMPQFHFDKRGFPKEGTGPCSAES